MTNTRVKYVRNETPRMCLGISECTFCVDETHPHFIFQVDGNSAQSTKRSSIQGRNEAMVAVLLLTLVEGYWKDGAGDIWVEVRLGRRKVQLRHRTVFPQRHPTS